MTDHLYTMAKTFTFLIERIGLKKLSDDELEALSSASDAATADATSLAKVIDSIGCLIDTDLAKNRQGGTIAGSLQGSKVPGHLASQVGTIGRCGLPVEAAEGGQGGFGHFGIVN